jgi:hypothetical protein
MLCSWACITPFCLTESENLKSSLCFLSVERIRSSDSVSAGISKLFLKYSPNSDLQRINSQILDLNNILTIVQALARRTSIHQTYGQREDGIPETTF